MGAIPPPAVALIVAGGTGGHLYPGIAVARALRGRSPSWEVIFAVRRGDLGKTVLEQEGFRVQEIAGQGMPRAVHLRALAFPWNFLRSWAEAENAVRRLAPQVVIGMGGYLSFPVLLAARRRKIPTLIHEQNVLPGLANRLLARWVDQVAVSFPGSEAHLKARKIWVSGLPVRHEIGTVSRAEGRAAFGLDRDRLTFLVFGGSLGARRMNQIVLEGWKELQDLAGRFQVLHIAGPKNWRTMAAEYKALPIKSVVLGYCHEMAAAYGAADAVICRAGASTVAELAIAARPAILIPFPYASDNHQMANARVLSGQGLAEVIEEKRLEAAEVARRLRHWIETPEALRRLQEAANRSPLAEPMKHAAARLADAAAGGK